MPRPRNNELTAAALMRFCAEHPNVPQGTKGYHLAKSEDARAHEQCVPPLAAFYDPITIAHEILAKLRELQTDGEEPVTPVPPIGPMRLRNRGGPRFVVNTLFSIVTDRKAPPAAAHGGSADRRSPLHGHARFHGIASVSACGAGLPCTGRLPDTLARGTLRGGLWP